MQLGLINWGEETLTMDDTWRPTWRMVLIITQDAIQLCISTQDPKIIKTKI